MIEVVVNLTNYDTNNHQWVGENARIDVYSFYKEGFKNKSNKQPI